MSDKNIPAKEITPEAHQANAETPLHSEFNQADNKILASLKQFGSEVSHLIGSLPGLQIHDSKGPMTYEPVVANLDESSFANTEFKKQPVSGGTSGANLESWLSTKILSKQG